MCIPALRDMLEEAGIELLFLPPYSLEDGELAHDLHQPLLQHDDLLAQLAA